MEPATTQVLPAPGDVRVVFFGDPTDEDECRVVMHRGEVLLAEMLVAHEDYVPRRNAEVTVNSLSCLIEDWHRVMLEPGDTVEVRLVPRGGDGSGSKIAQTLITLTAMVLAVIPGMQAFAAWIMLGAALINVGISLAFPPPSANFQQAPGRDTPLLTGTRNQLARWEPVPWVVGQSVRVYPPYAAKPFTEVLGGEQFLRLVFAVHGAEADTIAITDCFVGENALDNYDDVELQFHPGDGTTAPLTLFTQDVDEVSEQRVLVQGQAETFTSELDAQEVTLDILFPAGLFTQEEDGDIRAATFYAQFRYRAVGAGSWTDMVLTEPLGLGVEATATAGRYTVRSTQRGQTIRGFRFVLPSEGQYEVEVTKYAVSTGATSGTIVDDNAQVAVFRSVRTPTQAVVPNTIAHVALRILATDQLQGQLDTFSCRVTPVMQAWNSSTGFTSTTQTWNPSWNLLNVLRNGMGEHNVPDAQIDLDSFARFALFCSDSSYRIHAVIKEEKRFADWSNQIAASARGRLTLVNGKYGVMHDGEQDTPIQMITDRNSKGEQGRYLLPETIHALRVRFEDEDSPGEVSERMVYADGYTDQTATVIRDLDVWGVGDSDTAWRHGRYHLAASQLRRRYVTREMDYENLLFNVGDRIDLQMSVALLGGQPSRLVGLTGTKEDFTVTLDAPVRLEGGAMYKIKFRKSNMKVEEVSLDNVATTGDYTVLEGGSGVVNDPWDDILAPAEQALVVIGEANLVTVPMIVNGIEHMDDLKARVELMDYSEEILQADEGAIPPWDPTLSRPIADINVEPPIPRITNVQSDETVLRFSADGRYLPRILVSFEVPASRDAIGASVIGQYRLSGADSTWEQLAPVPANSQQLSFEPIEDGSQYDFRLRSVRPNGVASEWATQNGYTAIGRSTVPPDPSSFRREGNRLTWQVEDSNGDPLVVLDLAGYRIKYNFGASANWNTGLPGHLGLLPTQQVQLSDLPNVGRGVVVTLMLKLVDTLGNESDGFPYVTTTLNDIEVLNLSETFNFRDYDGNGTNWNPGTLTNCSVDAAGDLVATTNSAGFWAGNASQPFWTGTGSNLFWTNNFLEMSYSYYLFSPVGPLGPVKVTNIDIDGQYLLEYQKFGDGEWSLWPGEVVPNLAGLFGAIFVRVTIPGGVVQGKIRQLTFVMDPPDVRETGNDTFTGTGPGTPERLTLTENYSTIKEVFVTLTGASGAGTPVGYRVVDKNTSLGPQIELLDSANSVVGGTFDWEVIGY